MGRHNMHWSQELISVLIVGTKQINQQDTTWFSKSKHQIQLAMVKFLKTHFILNFECKCGAGIC